MSGIPIDMLENKLAAPAKRALEALNIETLNELSHYSPEELLKQHGIGKNALQIIISELANNALTLNDK